MSKYFEDIIRNEFKKILRDEYQDPFDTMPLADLGVDSLEFYETIMILEDKFGITIDDSELHSSVTLEQIFVMVDSGHTRKAK